MKYRLIGLFEILVGLSAIAGSYALFGRYHPPLEWLAGSPFHSYTIPGIILLVVIAGSYLLAGVRMWRQARYALEASAFAGFAMLIWIFVQISVIKHTSWLQVFYFAIGIATLIKVLYLLRYDK